MSTRRLGLSIGLALAFTAGVSAAQELYWTPWVSEENGGPATICQAWNEGAVGFGCSGSYCDNVRLLCETMPYGIEVEQDYWSNYFSEEDSGLGTVTSEGWYRYDGDNYEVCHRSNTAGVVNGIRCKGRYCDNISIKCGRPVKYKAGVKYSARLTNCSWSGWYSEEQGSVDFGWNRYVTGVKCAGSYCDRKSFLVCSLVDPAP